jgi:hypothetical protein
MATKNSIEALDRLVTGTITGDQYVQLIEEGVVEIPPVGVRQELQSNALLSVDQVSAIERRIINSGGTQEIRIPGVPGFTTVTTPEFTNLAEDLVLTEAHKAVLEQRNVIRQEAAERELTLDELLETPESDLRASIEQEALVEAGLELPTVAETIASGTDGGGVTEEEAPPAVIDFTPITLPNGDVHYRVKDMQTGNVTTLNPDDLEQIKLAKDLIETEIAERNVRITVAGEELDLKKNRFALDTMLSIQGLKNAQRQLEVSENKLELERELGKDRIALEEQALLVEQGPGATAINQAIQAGAESIDTSGVINVGGKPVDFEISDAVLDFFNLGGESKINLQAGRTSQLTDDLSLGTRAATPLGEATPLGQDVPTQNEILGRPASSGKLGELRRDIPLAAAFQALDEGDRNSVQQISNVLGLDLTKQLQEQSVPSGRGVFAQFRRN